MKREDLIKSKEYWITKIQLDLFNQLNDYMKKFNLNRTKLAKKLKVSKGYITQVLNGDFDHRISKLVDLSLAINKIPEINFKDLDQLIQEEKEGYISKYYEVKIKKSEILELKFKNQSFEILEDTPLKETIPYELRSLNLC